MIAKIDWFKRRKYCGWGVSPKSFKGWIYILVVMGGFIAFHLIPFWSNQLRLYVTIIWLTFIFLDIIPVMIFLKRDELEEKIEAISERNAAWFMSAMLVIGILHEILKSILEERIAINWFIVIALFGGAIVKTISNIVLEKRGFKE